jgi:hypothetical protein
MKLGLVGYSERRAVVGEVSPYPIFIDKHVSRYALQGYCPPVEYRLLRPPIYDHGHMAFLANDRVDDFPAEDRARWKARRATSRRVARPRRGLSELPVNST